MTNEPMNLKDLPGYIRSSRENGQTDVPVVQMGMIREERRSFLGVLAFAAAACLLVVMAVGFTRTERITIEAGDIGAESVAKIVSGEGGMFVSVTRNDDRTYSVRTLNLRNKNYFLERLRRNEEFEKVEPKE